VTRKKKLVCKVTVKKGTSTPTAAPVDPSQPTTQPVQTVIPVFDPASNTFTLKFNTAMTCSIAADNNNGDGTKEWISKSSQVASVNWQGTTNYLVRILKVVLSADAKTVVVAVAPNKMRVGARFDVVLTGFYQQGKTATTTPVRYSMNTTVPSLQLAVDDDLNQPYVDNNGNSSISITFNQPVKPLVNYDSVVGGSTYEKGYWNTYANMQKVAKVYQIASNGSVTNNTIAISKISAFNKSGKNDGTIEYITIDLGTVLTNITSYQIVIDGFALPSSSSATQLKTTATFKNEVMIKGQGSYTDLSSTQSRYNQDTDVVLYFKVMNNYGRGQTLTRLDNNRRTNSGAAAPSSYLTVLDSYNRSCTISYITSTKNSNDIEVGLYGCRGNTKYTLRFANAFPSVFLDLSSSQLMSPGADLVIGSVTPTATPTPGYVDTASWDNAKSAFIITLPQAFDTSIGYDENTTIDNVSVRRWWAAKADSLVTFYAADKNSGYYNRNNPLYIVPDAITLDNTSSRRLIIYMDPNDVTDGQRYAMVLNNWTYKSSGRAVSGVSYLSNVKKSAASGLSINTGASFAYAASASAGYRTHLVIEFNAAYSNSVATNEGAAGNYTAGWTGTAASNVCEITSSAKGKMGVLSVRKPVGSSTALDIELNGLVSNGQFTILMKNFYKSGYSASTKGNVTATYAAAPVVFYSRNPSYSEGGGSFVIDLPMIVDLDDSLSDTEVLSRCQKYVKVYGVAQGRISGAQIDDNTLELVVEGTGGIGQSTGGFRVEFAPEAPYALGIFSYQLCDVSDIIVTEVSNG
ncbi:MAG: hypothetical protein II915_05185, partial [Eubacterium sp.]|nr:hypothetical protein [Eubacterium sp.]